VTGYVVGYDAIRTNISSLPKGAQVYAGYATGSGVVPWTEADFTAHATALGPCLRIDQDPAASDATFGAAVAADAASGRRGNRADALSGRGAGGPDRAWLVVADAVRLRMPRLPGLEHAAAPAASFRKRHGAAPVVWLAQPDAPRVGADLEFAEAAGVEPCDQGRQQVVGESRDRLGRTRAIRLIGGRTRECGTTGRQIPF